MRIIHFSLLGLLRNLRVKPPLASGLRANELYCAFITILLLSAGPFRSALAQAQTQSLDLEQAIHRAEAANPQLLAAQYNLSVAQAGKEIAKAGPNPRLTVDYPFGLAETVHNVMVEQPIELGGKRHARLAVANDQAEQARLQYESLRWQIRSDVRQGFMELLIGGASLNEAQRAVSLNQDLVDIANKRLKAGDVAESDVIQAKFALGRIRQKLETTRNRGKQANIRLALLLGLSPDTIITPISPNQFSKASGTSGLIPSEVVLPGFDRLKEIALQSRYDLAISRTQVKAAEDQNSLARAGKVPDITAAAAYLWDPTIQATSTQIGMRVDIPIFNTHQGELEQALGNQKLAEAQYDTVYQQALSDVIAAYENFMSIRALVEQDQTNLLPQGEEVLALTRKSYELGQIGLTDVLVAEQSVLDQRDAYYTDLMSYETALVALERAVNQTLTEKVK